jgi:hypothetical protein
MGWACHWAHKQSTGSAPWKEIASLSTIIQPGGLLRPLSHQVRNASINSALPSHVHELIG